MGAPRPVVSFILLSRPFILAVGTSDPCSQVLPPAARATVPGSRYASLSATALQVVLP
jgi:hypothetical protein